MKKLQVNDWFVQRKYIEWYKKSLVDTVVLCVEIHVINELNESKDDVTFFLKKPSTKVSWKVVVK